MLRTVRSVSVVFAINVSEDVFNHHGQVHYLREKNLTS
jgi:hypothetical protein